MAKPRGSPLRFPVVRRRTINRGATEFNPLNFLISSRASFPSSVLFHGCNRHLVIDTRSYKLAEAA
jgi:hypothetical protein